MKIISGFLVAMSAAASAVCTAQTPATSGTPAPSATQVVSAPTEIKTDAIPVGFAPPRTLPSHPEEQPAATAPPAAPVKQQIGDYLGYQRIVVNGQERYCRNDKATGSRTQRTAVCLTQAQVKAEQLKTEEFMLETERRAAAMPASPMNIGGLAR